ncbi:E3 ubiquitin-protein ligase sina [Orussus abietinus]|uniref:E3 ubiquitin-protein ligase sina n=1 Tax=Orussus abietinus TaxID=222816 RepID=UPI000625D0AC|nr:E3 ubiquitin-protein ligase sina [Orussus abietinus]
MLNVLQQWSQRLFGRRNSIHASIKGSMTSSTNEPIRMQSEDPRELPRPIKFSKSSNMSSTENISGCYTNIACEDDDFDAGCSTDSACTCTNCTTLMTLTECGVCMEPLQGREVQACTLCSNMICNFCASKLPSCAFCRSILSTTRNRAMERLLDKMHLPCRNSRSGCKVIVNRDSRARHESTCSFATISCPAGRKVCGWYGTVVTIEAHLKKAHGLIPLINYGITVEIASFCEIARAREGRLYTVCLSCYDQLFMVKVILFQDKLKLSFTPMGYVRSMKQLNLTKYGVFLYVHGIDRHLRVILPFENNQGTLNIEITCACLYSSLSESSLGKSVKLDIVIRQIESDVKGTLIITNKLDYTSRGTSITDF